MRNGEKLSIATPIVRNRRSHPGMALPEGVKLTSLYFAQLFTTFPEFAGDLFERRLRRFINAIDRRFFSSVPSTIPSTYGCICLSSIGLSKITACGGIPYSAPIRRRLAPSGILSVSKQGAKRPPRVLERYVCARFQQPIRRASAHR